MAKLPMTAEGYSRLQEELKRLKSTDRPAIIRAISEARDHGDISENAEYIYGKRRLREIDRRVRFLRQRLEGMVVVEQVPADSGRVFFGAWVTLSFESGTSECYRIVGPDEFDRAPNYISMDAPLGRALMRRALNDKLTVQLPQGARSFVITRIEYGPRAGE